MVDKKLHINKVYNTDSRKINDYINDKIVDVTITSPPYYDLKDYGHNKQIGFGQSYEDYLNDLKTVFQNVYNCTKDDGTLWVIIDTFKKDGEMVPLPFDFISAIKPIGWKLQEVIIWGKDRTVPWAHKGQMRNVFEYILVFSKTNDFKFFIDNVRDSETLKKWWVKYPERYNPKGKTPQAIWHFDIPTQGSWGAGYIRHFCPLPEDMIEQILRLTTNEGGVVLDPFSGSGAVLSKAHGMKRSFIGFELNQSYISMFESYMAKTGKAKVTAYENKELTKLNTKHFQKLIHELRALKYARILYSKSAFKEEIVKIYVEKITGKPQRKNALFRCQYIILVANSKKIDKIKADLDTVISKEPLSKFGVEPEIMLVSKIDDFTNHFSDKRELYLYTNKVTHKFKSQFDSKRDLSKTNGDLIISKIKISLNEEDYA